jgi:hypothetical protein
MRLLGKTLASAALGAGLLAGSAISASAAIVCSGNVCWHTHETHAYPPDAKVIIHEDNWRAGPEDKYVFREHEGRGYWRDDKWTEW